MCFSVFVRGKDELVKKKGGGGLSLKSTRKEVSQNTVFSWKVIVFWTFSPFSIVCADFGIFYILIFECFEDSIIMIITHFIATELIRIFAIN